MPRDEQVREVLLPDGRQLRREQTMRGVTVRLEGLVKHFGKVQALKSLDLTLEGGELVAFLGPSGCGKTTTLLLLAGIYQPTAGRIYFADKRIDSLHPRDRDIGMVFQSYALYPHLTLFENIAFPLRLKRKPKDEVQTKVEQNAKLLGIDEQLQRRPSQVSGGQQQRAALARALVKEPQLLLLDEPLSNLDALIRLQARAEIRRLQQELGVTTILVTHDQSEALAMADRVAVFSVGEVQQFATPDELYRRPATTFVASFVGYPPMNLVKGHFNGAFQIGSVTVPVRPGHPGGEGTLGIRPEDIRLGGTTPGTILLVEPLGKEALLTVEVGGITLKVMVANEAPPTPGETIGLDFPLDRLHLFGSDGKRLSA
ncbi:MAG: ABC transporter ATP-binding protein [Deinococcota bacterium]|nr:ABC transporter ATP-binding protein [Deinococcota bacterium]